MEVGSVLKAVSRMRGVEGGEGLTAMYMVLATEPYSLTISF